jgi:transcriptional regulator with XRE-family HTH domain
MARLDVSSLGAYIREQRTSAELSIRELARVTGVSNPYLSQVERGIRQPSAQTLSRVADALRISAEQLYVRAGFLDRAAELSVKTALLEDQHLTDAQRSDLVTRYEQYVAANTKASAKKSTAKKATVKKAPAKKAPAKAAPAKAAPAKGTPTQKRAASKVAAKAATPKTPTSKTTTGTTRTERGRA